MKVVTSHQLPKQLIRDTTLNRWFWQANRNNYNPHGICIHLLQLQSDFSCSVCYPLQSSVSPIQLLLSYPYSYPMLYLHHWKLHFGNTGMLRPDLYCPRNPTRLPLRRIWRIERVEFHSKWQLGLRNSKSLPSEDSSDYPLPLWLV